MYKDMSDKILPDAVLVKPEVSKYPKYPFVPLNPGWVKTIKVPKTAVEGGTQEPVEAWVTGTLVDVMPWTVK